MKTPDQTSPHLAGYSDPALDGFAGDRSLSLTNEPVRVPLEKPAIMSLDNLAMSQLMVRLKPVTSAKGYQVQVGGEEGWLDAGVYAQTGRIALGNLVSGASYNVRARAVSSAGCSEWSDPVSRMVV